MKFKKLLIDTLKLLKRNKRQSILTSLAITVATFVLLVILSSSSYTTSTLGNDLKIEEDTATMTYTPQNMLDIRGFTQEDKQLVEQTIGKPARLSSSSYALYAETYFNDSKQNLSFRTLGDLNKNGLVVPDLLKGRALEELDGGVAISDKALMSLTRKENIEPFLGETINISGKEYLIQAIYYGSAVNERLPSLLVTNEIKELLLGGREYFDELVVETNQLENINKALSALDTYGIFRKEGTYGYIDNRRVYEETKAQATTILNFIALLSSISIFVAGFGVMNAMLSSVSERSKEIAIRRALGAKKSDIYQSYMMEGILLSLLGAITGIGVAILFVVLMNMSGFVTTLTLDHILITLFTTGVFGIVFSIMPAMVAANKNVIEGLR
ncbi:MULTISPECIES: FtsX-like permease family protein [unclassified Streptococcus]|uniref:ABC transporter permease n=1 Tax=unclassified Streptococcus TaxID=2608887 RepID=UPI001563CF7D|nr:MULTISPECIES: FtsX-like permease family protein [unclassified Streptococcus]